GHPALPGANGYVRGTLALDGRCSNGHATILNIRDAPLPTVVPSSELRRAIGSDFRGTRTRRSVRARARSYGAPLVQVHRLHPSLADSRRGGGALRILVTGAAGMLGSELVPELAKAGHQLVVTDVDLRQRRPWGPKGPMLGNLDVRAREDVQAAVNETRPDLVAHLAAETDLEACETDPDGAFHTNTLGTKFVALACRSAGVPMAYVSTAGVFDGASEEPYTEFDTPSPINVYGRSKLEGEHLVEQFVPEHYIVHAARLLAG